MVDTRILGRWKLARSDNVEEYMKASMPNMNVVLRKLAKTLSYQLEFSKEGDVYHINAFSTFKNQYSTFKLNEAFEDTDFSDKKFNVTYSLEEDGRLKSRREPVQPEDQTSLIEFFINDDDELVNVRRSSFYNQVSNVVNELKNFVDIL